MNLCMSHPKPKNTIMKIFTLFILLNFLYAQDTTSTWIEKWQRSTVSIGRIDTLIYNNNKIPYYKVIGTGVFFYVKHDTTVIPCLVTAKHVFEDSSKKWFPSTLRIRYSWFDNQPVDKYFGFEISLKDNKNKLWFEHPNTEVDLACIPILHIPSNVLIGNDNKFPVLPYNQIATDFDIYEGESIIVFGYPGAVGSDFSTKAIVRQGIIAWTSPNNASDSKMLIDCDIFPGNSGGPVFSHPLGLNRDGGFTVGKKIKFIGIVIERRKSGTEIFSSTNPNKLLKDNNGNLILSYESIGIGVVESSIQIRELLIFTQKEINK